MNVFIGYDPRQPVAYAVAAHSLSKNSSRPISIIRLELSKLPIKRRGLTEFTYSRFLAPYLSNFSGYSLFIDSDVLVLGDVYELLAYPIAYPEIPVFVAPLALPFERPSVMLFNNQLCHKLSPAFIEDPRNVLFDLRWAANFGSIPLVWNHLVGYDQPDPAAKLIHFTKGIPVWKETKSSEFSAEWWTYCNELGSTCSFNELMGKSVHVQNLQK